MYTDGVITTEFTGYVSGGEYISPSAKQTASIVFDGWYLSSEDLTTDGLAISSETGESEDITIGNAPAKVLTATMLNPNGLMDGLTWGEGTVYIGVVTASAVADTYASLPVHVLVGSTHYGINPSGNAQRGSTVYTLGGTPVAVISNADGTDVLFITDTSIGRYNGSFSVVSSPTAAQTFLAEKYRALTDPVGIVLDANGCPSVVNDVTNNTKTTTTNVPMGVFDFSGVDAFGITFGVEAYDRMTLFDADATDWVASLDFTTAKTLSGILSELMTEMGFSGNYTVSASAVNTTLTYTENPITAYAVTYRQILRWIAEAMGCSARMGRTGGVELWAWNSTPQETITPYTIISNTRTKARYTVPQITEVVCYDTLGYNYASGSEGVAYYIAANPFLTGLDTSVTPLTNINLLLRNIPVYYPSVIGQMYADPRLDTGDFVTLQTTDGTTPYAVPVMRQTLHWGGVCEATLVASGNQQRAVPSDLIENNLSTTVNGRKILEGVDAKRITVLDEDENILFNADTETDEVYIAGFTVSDSEMSASQTVSDTPHDQTKDINLTIDGVKTSLTYWEGLEVGYGKRELDSELSQGALVFNAKNYDRTDAFDYAGKTTVNGETLRIENPNTQNTGIEASVHKNSVNLSLNGDTVTPQIQVSRGNSNTTATIHNDFFRVNDGTNTTSLFRNGVQVTNGTVTNMLGLTGITFNEGDGTAPRFRVRQFFQESAGTKTISLESGIYLAITTHNNNGTSSQSGLAIIQCRSAGTSSVLNISTANNSTLSISAGTLTWTTTNTYRTLTLLLMTG